MAKKREYQIWNPGVNYYDSYLADLMTGTQNPEGTEAWKRERNLARKFASEKEDVALKGVLGGKRKLGKGERMPEGAYALANYPGLQSAIDWSMTGATPGGSAHIGLWLKEQQDPRLAAQNAQERQGWGFNQRQLLGGW